MHEIIVFGLPADRVMHGDCGYPIDAVQRRGELPRFARSFAFVGSPMWHKGVHVLLAAFDEVPRDTRLGVAGSHGHDSRYASLLEQHARYPGVHVVGAARPDCMPAFLAVVPVVASRMSRAAASWSRAALRRRRSDRAA
jgi:glycosyltransferase involved in cell wall biosynthesis